MQQLISPKMIYVSRLSNIIDDYEESYQHSEKSRARRSSSISVVANSDHQKSKFQQNNESTLLPPIVPVLDNKKLDELLRLSHNNKQEFDSFEQ